MSEPGPPARAGAASPRRSEAVERALEQLHRLASRPRAPSRPALGKYLFATALLVIANLLVQLELLGAAVAARPFIPRFVLALLLGALLLTGNRLAAWAIERTLKDEAVGFNARRVLRLALALGLTLVGLSLFFEHWATAAVSLGLLSLIVGFALQTPITSLIGWFYIVLRGPYRVGDRVRIGDAKGDVIGVGYFDTTLWESAASIFRRITRAAASSSSPTHRCSPAPSTTTPGLSFPISGTRSECTSATTAISTLSRGP